MGVNFYPSLIEWEIDNDTTLKPNRDFFLTGTYNGNHISRLVKFRWWGNNLKKKNLEIVRIFQTIYG